MKLINKAKKKQTKQTSKKNQMKSETIPRNTIVPSKIAVHVPMSKYRLTEEVAQFYIKCLNLYCLRINNVSYICNRHDIA